MEKLKDMLVPGIMVLLGSIDYWIGLVDTLVREAGWPAWYATAFRLFMSLVTIIVTGAPPQIKKYKQRRAIKKLKSDV